MHAQCPYVYGEWAHCSEHLAPVAEDDGYGTSAEMTQLFAEIYDPVSADVDEATRWPSRATTADLEGLPPHVISANEADPLRDEGPDYYCKLLAAGVTTIGWMNPGLAHEGEILFRTTMPDVYATNIRNVNGFARSLP